MRVCAVPWALSTYFSPLPSFITYETYVHPWSSKFSKGFGKGTSARNRIKFLTIYGHNFHKNFKPKNTLLSVIGRKYKQAIIELHWFRFYANKIKQRQILRFSKYSVSYLHVKIPNLLNRFTDQNIWSCFLAPSGRAREQFLRILAHVHDFL